MKIVHLGGTKGVGKTTLINGLSHSLTPGFTLKAITVSSFLFELARKKFKQEWSELEPNERAILREILGQEIVKFNDDATILDSHYVDIIEGTPVSIMPPGIKDIIDVHIVLEASASRILARRRKDQSFRRRDLSLSAIRTETDAERTEAIRLAADFEKPLYIVDNIEVSQSTRRILSIIEATISMPKKEVGNESHIHNIERG